LLFGRGRNNPASQPVTEIPVESIALNPHQPREAFDEKRLEELAASIREHGIIQPLVVRQVGNAFELIAGERRLRAARLAGLSKVPVVVRDVGPQEMAVLALIENLQREDLNVIEEARGYRRLIEEYSLTQAEVGRLVGKGQSTIANKLRLLRLPAAVQARILADGVSERHARALLDLPDEASQMAMLDRVVRERLSVRETEERVRALVAPVAAAGSGGGPGVDAGAPRRQSEAPAEVGLFTFSGDGAAGRRGRSQLEQVSDRRAIRAFRDVRLFLNTFRRAVEMLREAGVRAEMVESDGPDYLEIKVLIPKDSAARGGGARSSGPRSVGSGRGAGKRGPATGPAT